MPIDVTELKRAAEPLERRILSLLERDSSKAYATSEILAFTEGYDLDSWTLLALSTSIDRNRLAAALDACERALLDLEGRGLGQRADVRGTKYFAVKQR